MFQIDSGDDGTVIVSGRLDAAQAPRAQEFLDNLQGACVLDMGQLEYISSAGLGVLLRTHKRLMGAGEGLRLVNVSKHINDIFMYSGFDKLFSIEVAGGEPGTP
ncbi:MAG: STAS domain-containing protein [Gammaproteobacteria bacterium]|nr:STAS domain-containing protein [Gammaproteobacteria bacterium]NNF61747.1 STAS domain-containing protein [Gammaproteobacteria bacterium]NNM21775.1 STAS domain-containing protein [Gammaproteobacteria bacterium]